VSWASHHIEKLLQGEVVQFRPRGNSMRGKIESGQLVTVAPLKDRTPQIGDIVLCKVNGARYLHLVKAISGECFQIGKQSRPDQWLDVASKYLRDLYQHFELNRPTDAQVELQP